MLSSPSHRARLLALPSPTLAQADDATLARAARERDPRAASVFWDRFSPLVRRVLRRTLGPEALVEGLLQEVFLRLFTQLCSPRDLTELRQSVIGVSAQVLRGELRRRRLRRLLRLRDAPVLPEPEATLADPTTRAALRSLYGVLDGLHPETRLIFALQKFEGLRAAEIATALDVPLATAKRCLEKADAQVGRQLRRDVAFRAYAGVSTSSSPP